MTDRELMQQALEALEKIAAYRPLTFAECSDAEAVMGIAENAIPALRERLAQPEQAWITAGPHTAPLRTHWEGCEEVHPECKKTRRRQWQGLTDEEIKTALNLKSCDGYRAIVRAIEAKLREKNT